LFGPRQTGKSTWLKTKYPEALFINLLSNEVFQDYSLNPRALSSDILIFKRKNKSNLIIIDEIQKLPALLDDVHDQIEQNKDLRFILTGSSARKLKRSGLNLLGGRASLKKLFPLVYPEIEGELKTLQDLEHRLSAGGLPSVFSSPAPFDDLNDYIQLYLNEEVKAEGLIRNHQAFHRFLLTASLANSQQINFSQIGADAQIPPRTIHDYFQILEDTLIGFMLPAFTQTLSRKAMTSAKFYFFDTGVANALKHRSKVLSGTVEFGESLENFVVSEVRAYLSYKNQMAEMFYWRTLTKIEVDLIVRTKNKLLAIEVKSKNKITPKDCAGLQAFSEDYPNAKKYIVTAGGRYSVEENKIEVLPILKFLQLLWDGEII
jgi:predicted AAA+ superfamily ATPase